MYVVNASYGDCDAEPEMAMTEILGIYESLDEACEAATSKFDAIMERLGEIDGSSYDYYDTCGDHDTEFGRVFSGHDHYCQVRVVER